MEVDIENRCKHYFYNLNPIAQKFAKDIENTREAYQDLWNSMSREEQTQVVNENIITPAAVLKYDHIQVPSTQNTSNTYSWFTRSQLDLFTCLKPNASAPEAHSVGVRDLPKEADIDAKKTGGSEDGKHSLLSRLQTPKSLVLKPKSPPPPPPTVRTSGVSAADQNVSVEKNEANQALNDIPKTGFDFLDNW